MTGDDSERARGMFDSVDREYLRGQKEYQVPQSEYERRKVIRQRLFDGIVDFVEAQQRLSNWNWQKFLDQDFEDENDLIDGMASAIALFYEYHQAKNKDFERTLDRAIEEAHTQGWAKRDMPNHEVRNVELDIDTADRPSPKEVRARITQKISDGVPLTDTDIAEGLRWGDIETKNAIEEHGKRQKEERALDKKREWFEHKWG
ncbi:MULTISPECIES: hypothetical protein [Halobacteriales]|nr:MULTISPECIES: hypothetical protein [Halobacteria]MCD2205325.1 hypothetical protein [Halobacterium sp. KA-6]